MRIFVLIVQKTQITPPLIGTNQQKTKNRIFVLDKFEISNYNSGMGSDNVLFISAFNHYESTSLSADSMALDNTAPQL